MTGVVDILRGSPVLDVDGAFSVLDPGLSATLTTSPIAEYLGQTVPASGSTPEARRPRLRFLLLAPVPATLADGRPITVVPTALLEVP